MRKEFALGHGKEGFEKKGLFESGIMDEWDGNEIPPFAPLHDRKENRHCERVQSRFLRSEPCGSRTGADFLPDPRMGSVTGTNFLLEPNSGSKPGF